MLNKIFQTNEKNASLKQTETCDILRFTNSFSHPYHQHTNILLGKSKLFVMLGISYQIDCSHMFWVGCWEAFALDIPAEKMMKLG